MMASGLGNQTKPCLRVVAFMVFMVCMLFLYYYHDTQYYNFVDYTMDSYVAKNYNDSDLPEEVIRDGYIVWSPSCRIPNISAHHKSIVKFEAKWKPLKCSSYTNSLTKIVYNDSKDLHSIIIDEKQTTEYAVQSESLKCCYKVISRPYQAKLRNLNDDDRITISKAICYGTETVLPKGTEYIYVECKSSKSTKFVYKNIHSMVLNKVKFEKPETKEDSKFSVLMFGIDSISRLNLIRTMPKTFNYLNTKNWLPLEGYVKIGDNTFPNLVAILTGSNDEQLRKQCWKSGKSKLDTCPFIWKEYKTKGYATAYIEDTPEIGTFNFKKYGFLNSPTDYYLRPFLLAGYKLLKTKRDGGMEYCIGLFPSAEYLFEYVSNFVKRFQNKPYFNLFWTNSFSHNELNMPNVMDKRVTSFLEDIENYLNNTIVIFLSDHGMRFGKIRETFVGWLEERMPYIYFWIPPAFKERYPEKYANLLANKNRLTSPYDLHATLQDILYGEVKRKPKSCDSCNTLFQKAEWNRSCQAAGISEHWCTCSSEFTSMSTKEPVILSAAHYAIRYINNYLSTHKTGTTRGTRCATLRLESIISVRSRIQGLRMFQTQTYVIVLVTKPSRAIFEITIKYKTDFEIANSISRINAYGNQSWCVSSDANLKMYCFCI